MAAAPERKHAINLALQARERERLGPLLVGHRCTEHCRTEGTRRVRVCIASMNVHECPGESCEFARHTGEGVVCGLSGYCIGGPDDTSTVSFTSSNGVTASSSRHWGQSVRISAKTGGRSGPIESAQLTRKAVEAHVHLFLASDQRREITDAEMCKVRQSCERAAKMDRTTPYVGAVVAEVTRLYRARAELCAPAAPATAPWLKTLATAIFTFWQGIDDGVPMKKKNAASFVAAILSFMASKDGLSLHGVVYIKPSPLVRRHSVLPRQMGSFKTMTCRQALFSSRRAPLPTSHPFASRRVTQMVRLVKNAVTLESGQPRLVEPLVFA